MVLIDFADLTGRPQRLCFHSPVQQFAAHTVGEVLPALRAVRDAQRAGYYAAGMLSYEAAPAFDPALCTHVPRAGLPLLWFGIYRAPAPPPAPTAGGFQLGEWQADTSPEQYAQAIEQIRAAIGRGATYQANYTMRLHAGFTGDDLAWYERLRAGQRASYCAYLDLGRHRILSASPELFFRWGGTQIVTRPMKGTAPRGRWLDEDRAQAAWLAASEKNRAENLMIVDLLRNDLGRVAQIGTIRVPQLFELERYPTLHQLTSTVTARTRPGVQIDDIFAALFPCGSITGAPKIATMRLIAALEAAPRGAYCGAIGLLAPTGEAAFNVAIRTATLDTHTGLAEYGVGGGITWDSTAADEHAEALLKAALLSARAPSFELLETMRLEQGRFSLRERHLARLAASADYFDIPLDTEGIARQLDALAAGVPAQPQRVRLLVGQDGQARIEAAPLVNSRQPAAGLPTADCRLLAAPQPVAFARSPVARSERFLFHKTTQRAIYERHRAEQPELFDVLLWNEQGEVTEFTIGNLVAEIAGQRYTPPIACGVLPGTLRAELLAHGALYERVLTREDVAQATQLWLINSVRGWVPVRLLGDQQAVSFE